MNICDGFRPGNHTGGICGSKQYSFCFFRTVCCAIEHCRIQALIRIDSGGHHVLNGTSLDGGFRLILCRNDDGERTGYCADCSGTHGNERDVNGFCHMNSPYDTKNGGESGMTDKEWRMAQNFSKLPEALQIKMLDKLDGAIMALDMLQGMKEQPAREASR